MSLSRSAVERANPPPRRKSCDACIKAKRRCDYGKLACVRCAQRGLDCVYSGCLQHRPDTVREVTPDVANKFCFTPSALEQVADLWNGSMLEASGFDIDSPRLASTDFGPHVGLLDVALDSDTDPLDNLFSGGSDKVDTPIYVLSPSPTCPQISTDSQGRIFEIIAVRFQYAIDEIKRAPTTMVLETRTPWHHPQLFRGPPPRSMLDAHAACALYIAKTTCNARDIVQSIEARIEDLLISPKPTTAPEILALVQSLLLYEIMCTFDNDLRFFTALEKTTLALEDSTLLLMSHLGSGQLSLPAQHTREESLQVSSLEEARPFWTSWIFHESARRTLMIALFFIQLHRVLSGTLPFSCDGDLHIRNSWTLSAHLWNAEDLFNFTAAWRSKRHLVIKDGVFSDVLMDVEAGDVDVFGKILFTLFMGIDQTKAWFAARGGML
ncbi:hypothetical protein PV08_05360 [Exophiala spinifera]|uniref:Zn(2)-C6 fungal-type domain-containing protein n=1 Tax=Exophiala spinifera TaxID=91928 RepID=A0A0D2B9J4_9EURO|nr:uncharacterized protein PV08_05360 [Exophiala spinifera]KIW15315.1 hypothetical protein PV08_05360 [Exophiala spinifera]